MSLKYGKRKVGLTEREKEQMEKETGDVGGREGWGLPGHTGCIRGLWGFSVVDSRHQFIKATEKNHETFSRKPHYHFLKSFPKCSTMEVLFPERIQLSS
jgi:hypothetical protein